MEEFFIEDNRVRDLGLEPFTALRDQICGALDFDASEVFGFGNRVVVLRCESYKDRVMQVMDDFFVADA